MSTPKQSNSTVIGSCTRRLDAIVLYLTGVGTITINGADHTAAQLTAVYQADIDTRSDLLKKRSDVTVAMKARAVATTTRRAADKWLRAWVINKFGADSKQALDFGFAPRTPRARKSADKAKAAEQAMATREARHTLGPVQKAKIKGTAVAPTAPAAPAATHASPPMPATTNGATTHI